MGLLAINSATLARLDIGDRCICEREEVAPRQDGEERDEHVGLPQRMLCVLTTGQCLRPASPRCRVEAVAVILYRRDCGNPIPKHL